jgi:tripartite ATP-independent transporter DctP family solute receptor
MSRYQLKLFLSLCIIFLCVGIAFGGGTGETKLSAPTKELIYAHIFETSHPYHKWADWAGQQIAAKTGGRYKMKVYPAGTLGKEEANLEGLNMGTVDLMPLGITHAGNVYGDITASIAPFVYRDFDHWVKFPKSPIFYELASEFEKKSGHHILGLTYYGQRHVTSNKPILKPEDMKGLKLRVPGGALMLVFPRAVGANPTPMAFGEVYMALQQGVVDAQENPLPTIKANKFYEVQKYINLTGHISDCHLYLVSKKAWGSLSESDKKIFTEIFAEAARQSNDEIRKAELELVAWFKERGNIITEPDRVPFAAAVESYIKTAEIPFKLETYRKIRELK